MKNVGRLDQQVRYVIGALLLAYAVLGFFLELPIEVGAAVAGVVFIGTAQMRFCGLYKLIGVNTCPIDEQK